MNSQSRDQIQACIYLKKGEFYLKMVEWRGGSYMSYIFVYDSVYRWACLQREHKFVDVFVTLECIHLYISYCISFYPDGDVCSSDRESH